MAKREREDERGMNILPPVRINWPHPFVKRVFLKGMKGMERRREGEKERRREGER